jgi:hypothetical protein
MKHYRCQNVYITATASDRIVNTLDFPPNNLPMPQMSSTDHILMAAQEMKDSLKHPHPDVPFSTIGDDTISALATLADIFTRKFKKPEATNGPPAPTKTAANKRQNSQPQTELMSPIKQNQTCNNLRGWSYPQHLRRCKQGRTDCLRETFPGTFWTSVALIVQLHLVKTIGKLHQ